MGGPSTKPSEQIAQQQQQQSQQIFQQSQDFQQQMQKYLQPSIDYYSALASGDPSKTLAAAQPALAPIYASYPGAKEQIRENVPTGIGQDLAIADLERNKAGGVASALSSITQGSYDKLANIASGLGSFSLQDLGASLRAGEGAASTYGTVMNAQANTKASQLGLLGSLAGAAGTAYGGKSDRRLKTNLRKLGTVLVRGTRIPLYRFDFINGPKNQDGVMAQDLLRVMPEAVGTRDGYFTVDYTKLAAEAELA